MNRIGSLLLSCLLAVATGAGCVSADQIAAERGVADYYAGAFSQAERELSGPAQNTNENFVLNNDRLGSAALANYDLREAESAFLRSYEVINSVGVNNGARTLAATVIAENIKVWKGEPFERAMANFYLGLVYYMRGDYQNARAAFENALFKLRDYGDNADSPDQYRAVESDFALGYLMLGKCWQRLGQPDKAQRAFNRVADLRPDLTELAGAELNERSNMLLVVDYGQGPEKVRSRDGALAGFVPPPSVAGPIYLPAVTVDNRQVNLDAFNRPTVDLLALAQDRRWQDIDTIRAVKSALGTGLIAGGAIEGLRRHGDPAIGAALIAGGLLLKASSQADVRYWELLPRSIFVLPLRVEPGPHDVTVYFPGTGYQQTWRGLTAPAQGESTYYIHMQRYSAGPFLWPPPALAGGGANP